MVIAQLARLLRDHRGPISTKRVPVGADVKAICAHLPDARVFAVDACGSVQHDLALVRSIVERFPATPVLVLSEVFTATNAIPFLRMGVKGLLSYDDAPRRFREAVTQVAGGGLWVSREIMSAFVEAVVRPDRHRLPHIDELTPREQEVLRGLLDNRSNKEIGSRLNISERTAKFHVANLLKKVGVRRRSDLIAQWWQSCALPN